MSGTLSHSPADVLAVLLPARGFGSNPDDDPGGAWPVYALDPPDVPDQQVRLTDAAGRDVARPHLGGRVEYYGVQAVVVAGDPVVGYARASALAAALDALRLAEVTVDGVGYLVHTVQRTGPVLPLGRESPTSDRRLFSLNCLVTLSRRP